jgi:AcrR family transcriptional regulator
MPESKSSNKSSNGNRKRSGYHRGNVREDLIKLAREILESEGLNAITLRRLTREIGVNPTNFYNHFLHMDYLNAAIKVEGHQELLELHKKAVKNSPNRKEAFLALCHEYVFFAVRHPNLYRLMFDDVHNFEKHVILKEQSDRTMAFVVETLYGEDIFDGTDSPVFYQAYPLAITCWSLLHGLSHILIERQVRIKLRSRKEVSNIIDSTLGDLINGIGDQLES